jgi:hypothetical protein
MQMRIAMATTIGMPIGLPPACLVVIKMLRSALQPMLSHAAPHLEISI